MRFGAFDRVGDPRERRRLVDEDLELIPLPRRGVSRCVASWRRIEGVKVADPRQPAPVARHHSPLHRLTESAIQEREAPLHRIRNGPGEGLHGRLWQDLDELDDQDGDQGDQSNGGE